MKRSGPQVRRPRVLQLDEVARPEAGAGQVLVARPRRRVNPVDTYVRSGSYAMLPTPPYIPATTRPASSRRSRRRDQIPKGRPRVPSATHAAGRDYAELAVATRPWSSAAEQRLFSQGAAVSVP